VVFCVLHIGTFRSKSN